MNQVSITGNITADAEMKALESGWNIINFSIANNDKKKKKSDGSYEDVVSFFNITFFSKSGKMVNYLLKGKMVTIGGQLKQERWEKDGQKFSKVVITARDIVPHKWEQADTSFPPADNNGFSDSPSSTPTNSLSDDPF